MKHSKWISKYAADINELAEEHLETLLAIYSDAYDNGLCSGVCMGVSTSVIVGVIGLCIAGIAYLKHKEQS